ncbi:Maf family protein [Peptoniphilus catoniae]|uniref:Maf family protein n=1 Tax=Peptoniphilus catoniae TaxID=1660341 RepID=UPI0010FD87A9|nr:Maf family protein [Peptoniphilus catoniae]
MILASKSERRFEILSKYTDFKVITKDVEENNKDYLNARQLAMGLSFEKGIAVAKEHESELVLSADTVVEIDGEIFGKPTNEADAYRMINRLSASGHRVITAYSIFRLDDNIKYTNYEESSVYFKDLSEDDIKAYIDTKEYIGKAGAYAIQGYGSLLVERIEGDFYNIVGLPISKIASDLQRLLNISLLRCSHGSR